MAIGITVPARQRGKGVPETAVHTEQQCAENDNATCVGSVERAG